MDALPAARLTVRVQPRAHDSRVVGFDEAGRLKVRVSAAPTDGKASEAVIAVLAEALRIPRRQIEIERGYTSRTKTVRVDGISREQVERLLGMSEH